MMLLKEHIVSSYRAHIACDLVLLAAGSMALFYNITDPVFFWQLSTGRMLAAYSLGTWFWIFLDIGIILPSGHWLWRDVRDYLVIRKALKNGGMYDT